MKGRKTFHWDKKKFFETQEPQSLRGRENVQSWLIKTCSINLPSGASGWSYEKQKTVTQTKLQMKHLNKDVRRSRLAWLLIFRNSAAPTTVIDARSEAFCDRKSLSSFICFPTLNATANKVTKFYFRFRCLSVRLMFERWTITARWRSQTHTKAEMFIRDRIFSKIFFALHIY